MKELIFKDRETGPFISGVNVDEGTLRDLLCMTRDTCQVNLQKLEELTSKLSEFSRVLGEFSGVLKSSLEEVINALNKNTTNGIEQSKLLINSIEKVIEKQNGI